MFGVADRIGNYTDLHIGCSELIGSPFHPYFSLIFLKAVAVNIFKVFFNGSIAYAVFLGKLGGCIFCAEIIGKTSVNILGNSKLLFRNIAAVIFCLFFKVSAEIVTDFNNMCNNYNAFNTVKTIRKKLNR